MQSWQETTLPRHCDHVFRPQICWLLHYYLHSYAQRKLSPLSLLSPLSPLNPLNILLSITGLLLSLVFNGLNGLNFRCAQLCCYAREERRGGREGRGQTITRRERKERGII